MRVVISMDNCSDFDGASKVHTIKRYLSEIKEDANISSSGVRCRELDCLRAYYYLGILYHLRDSLEVDKNDSQENIDSCPKQCVNKDNQVNDSKVKKNNGENSNHSNLKIENTSVVSSADKSKLSGTQGVPNVPLEVVIPSDVKVEQIKSGTELVSNTREVVRSSECIPESHKQQEINVMGERTSQATTDDTHTGNLSQSTTSNIPEFKNTHMLSVSHENPGANQSKCVNNQTEVSNADSAISVPDVEATTIIKSAESGGHLMHNDVKEEVGNVTSPQRLMPNLHTPGRLSPLSSDSSHPGLTKLNLSPISGHDCSHLYLSVQEYVTESRLRHLSRGLLWDLQAKRYALTETLGYIHKAISQLLLAQKPKSVSDGQQDNSIDGVESLLMQTGSDHSTDGTADSHITVRGRTAGYERSLSAPVSDNLALPHSTDQNVSLNILSDVSSNPNFHRLHSMPMNVMDFHLPHIGHAGGPMDDGNPLDVCSSCELLTKSRKVLWEDDPQWQYRLEQGTRKMTSIVNPAKYINVPDEWYNMPANRKYFMPYVTMAILKDEQEYVVSELKRGPDSIQVRPVFEVTTPDYTRA